MANQITKKDRHTMVLKPFRITPKLARRLALEKKRRGRPHSENSIVNEVLERHFAQIDGVLEGKTQLQAAAQR